MDLRNFLNENDIKDRFIKEQPTSPDEIRDLFSMADRYLKDYRDGKEVNSTDAQFSFCYSAALKICTLFVRAIGHRVSGGAHHFITMKMLIYIMGEEKRPLSNYLDKCRVKRNKVEYESVGGVNEDEVEELHKVASDLRLEAEKWMYANHLELMSDD